MMVITDKEIKEYMNLIKEGSISFRQLKNLLVNIGAQVEEKNETEMAIEEAREFNLEERTITINNNDDGNEEFVNLFDAEKKVMLYEQAYKLLSSDNENRKILILQIGKILTDFDYHIFNTNVPLTDEEYSIMINGKNIVDILNRILNHFKILLNNKSQIDDEVINWLKNERLNYNSGFVGYDIITKILSFFDN
jgi:hypothetical protein